jgi:hypothetical protein
MSKAAETRPSMSCDWEAVNSQLRTLLDPEVRHTIVRLLSLAWHVARSPGEPCESLRDLALRLGELPSAQRDYCSEARELIELVQCVAGLACKVGASSSDDAVRHLCLGLARHCSGAAAQIQRHVLWTEKTA